MERTGTYAETGLAAEGKTAEEVTTEGKAADEKITEGRTGCEEAEFTADMRFSPAGKIMCGMAAALEEMLLFMAAGIQADLMPFGATLVIWAALMITTAGVICEIDDRASRADGSYYCL